MPEPEEGFSGMRVAVVGSREYPDEAAVRACVRRLVDGGDQIVSGGAGGVDKWAESEARNGGQTPVVIRPEYGRHPGKVAPKIRNWAIAHAADRVIAFWEGYSTGTSHVVACFLALGKPVDLRWLDSPHNADSEAAP